MKSILHLSLLITTLFPGCDLKNEPKRLWPEGERQILVDGLAMSRDEVLNLSISLEDSLWQKKNAPTQWSVAEVLEHLILQDQAYYREIKVVSALPVMPEFVERVKGNDDKFLEYASDPAKGKADWDVTPTGRFCSKQEALTEFKKVRDEIIRLVSTSDSDFRQVFTFRKIPQKVIDSNPEFYRVRQVRDLHQLVLNAIAHTQRHIGQIKRIESGLRAYSALPGQNPSVP